MTLEQAILAVLGALFVILCAAVRYIWARMDKRIDSLDTRLRNSERGAQAEKVRRLEIDYRNMHDWKTSILPRQFEQLSGNLHGMLSRIEADVNRRLDRIERRVFNGEKP